MSTSQSARKRHKLERVGQGKGSKTRPTRIEPFHSVVEKQVHRHHHAPAPKGHGNPDWLYQ